MAFEITSHASSSLQSVVAPKELLSVLNILSEKQKMKYKQEKRQELQQHQQYQHLHNHYQHHGQQQQQNKEQQQLDKSKWESKHKESQKLMELSQIKLIYLAEGNANLVLALPQFKKVLRLPKILKQHEEEKQLKPKKTHSQEAHRYQKNEQPQGQLKQMQKQRQQQDEINQQEPSVNLTTGQQESDHDAVGILTMDHYVAYISIIRCLVGNEFVFEADIVAVPNPTDRHWINEHIKPYRPVNRLDKDFGGHFGLLLPDATQLPAEFDILFSNLQFKAQPEMLTTTTETSNCSSSSSISNTDNSCSVSNNIFGSDAFAIEIKPKQGWLLPNDVNNLFDVKPKIKQITNKTTPPPGLRETKTTLKTAVATTIIKKWDKKSTDIESFTATQNEPTATTRTTQAKPKVKKREKMSTTTSQTEVTMTGSCCSDSMASTSAAQGDDKISHSLYDTVDPRCRYCCMQFLKMKQKKIVERSQYCPIDLFSGSNERMCFALQALFECPQNNLRIFKNGNLLYDDRISRTCKLEDLLASDKLQLIKHLLVTCLLREYDNRGERKHNGSKQINKDTQQQLLSSAASVVVVDTNADADAEMEGGVEGASAGVAVGQPQSSVTSCKKQKLNTIPIPKVTVKTTTTQTETEVTKVKSTLASTESIFSMNNCLMSTPVHYNTGCLEQINKAEMTCLPKNCVLQKILHLQSLAKINLQYMLDHEYADNKAKTYEILFKLLEKFSKADNSLTLAELSPEEQYTLAATALDCSIMITFCEIENIPKDAQQTSETTSLINNPFVVSVWDRTYLTKVTLLDLDPKPDAHFHKYFLQMKQIADALKEL